MRDATAADADTLADFNARMAWETEGKRLLPHVVGAGVRRLLGEPGLGYYLVAEADGESVASLLVTTEWSDWRNGRFWWIQSVYVVPAGRRSGVFRALYADVEARARAASDVVGLRLYVESDNERAQRTYENLGMEASSYRFFERGFVKYS